MQVLLSLRAEQDLIDIGDRIAVRSPASAARFVDRLREQCRRVAELPHAWPNRPDWGPDVRSTAMGRYIIVHRVRGDALQILRIVHGARDLDRLFEDEPPGK